MSNVWQSDTFGQNFGGLGGAAGRKIPTRGGGELGKKARQNEQVRLKDAKILREIDYYWECQDRNAEKDWRIGGPPRKGQRFLDDEERELFSDSHQLEGIDFGKYSDIQVQRQGRQAEHIPVIETFSQCFQMFELPKWLENNVHLMRTGSGKTAAFLLPLVAAMNQQTACGNLTETYRGPAKPSALIMAPTRELVSQIFLESRKFCHRSPFKTVQVYGGVESKPQLKELSRGVDLVAATPGRLSDFVQRGVIVLSGIDYLVLDEADRMLDMGFEPQIRQIVEGSDMPSKEHRQTMFFSATFPKEIQVLAQDFLYDYIWIAVGRVGAAASSVEQRLLFVHNARDKIGYLLEELRLPAMDGREDLPSKRLTLVFVAMKRTAAWLVRELNKNRISAVAIHGDLTQMERERNLFEFKSGGSPILVATDVAARGLDIPLVCKVINYDLPGQIDDYVHRIGRTGRVGHRGVALSFFLTGSGVEGNSGIAADLLDRIEDAGCEVPTWLEDVVLQGGGRKQKNTFGAGRKMGGRDIRNGKFGAGDGFGRRKGPGGKGGDRGKTGKGGAGGQSWGPRSGDVVAPWESQGNRFNQGFNSSFGPSKGASTMPFGGKNSLFGAGSFAGSGKGGKKSSFNASKGGFPQRDDADKGMELWMSQRQQAA
eukprot:GEMP01014108.1.p1 GENE.GEMP01014108.1~~GEMP01014108.1.p1  ORF type:complete len:667 (+),score=140.79 GEMP01014108.1:42-2003(+)